LRSPNHSGGTIGANLQGVRIAIDNKDASSLRCKY
jgi:hypothetical protein